MVDMIPEVVLGRSPTRGGGGGNAPGRHFWWKERIAGGCSGVGAALFDSPRGSTSPFGTLVSGQDSH